MNESFGMVGTVSTSSEVYEVVWVDQDLANIEQDGDVILQFCSKWSNGFHGVDDVLDQANDVVVDWEIAAWDVLEDAEDVW